MKIVSPTFPVKCDVIYWKPHGRIKGYIKQVLQIKTLKLNEFNNFQMN